jgi:hypothetical protein
VPRDGFALRGRRPFTPALGAMGEGFGAFALGLWCGLTGPTAIHVGMVLLQRDTEGSALSWVIRLIVAPAALLGVLGVAAALGLYRGLASWAALGLFVGFALYGLCAWLNYKKRKNAAVARHGT